jgi:hypothetical protein
MCALAQTERALGELLTSYVRWSAPDPRVAAGRPSVTGRSVVAYSYR